MVNSNKTDFKCAIINAFGLICTKLGFLRPVLLSIIAFWPSLCIIKLIINFFLGENIYGTQKI